MTHEYFINDQKKRSNTESQVALEVLSHGTEEASVPAAFQAGVEYKGKGIGTRKE